MNGRRTMVAAGALAAALAVLAAGCGLEGELFGPAMDRGHEKTPPPADNVVAGQVSGAPGATVAFYGGGGAAVQDTGATVGEDGVFQQRFPGELGIIGLFIWVEDGARVLVGLLPELPAQTSVYDPERVIELWTLHPTLADLTPESTTIAMVLSAAARNLGVGVDALTPAQIAQGVETAWELLQQDSGGMVDFARAVATLDAAARLQGTQPVFTPEALRNPAVSFLNTAWLAEASVDYDGDGVQDVTTDRFDELLAIAVNFVGLGVCYEPDRIRVIFKVDLGDGAKNANCDVVNHYKWAQDLPGKSMFITGGIHEDTPRCGGGRTDHCLTEAQIDAFNQLMGNWTPNQIPMFDDGTNGDEAAGDGVWTFVVDAPYIPTGTSPDGAGVRLGYKYTWGLPGQLWTGAEEWPGNQRLLEVEDLNGDHLVTREDVFGDEAANKDKVNLLKPKFGGTGCVTWVAVEDTNCRKESRENQVDTDGDCVVDTWADPGPVAPLTVPCEE